jgi:hypothetical protein
MYRLFFITFCPFFLSCNVKREGIPENQRNYSEQEINKVDSTCKSAPDGLFAFHKINADTIYNAITEANLKYFGKNFVTTEINKSIREWLSDDYFSTKTSLDKSWNLYCQLDTLKFSTGYHSYKGLEKFGIKLFFHNTICFKKWIMQEGTYNYSENYNGIFREYGMNRLRFLCEFHVDITFTPKSIFKNSKTEYYRVAKTDTVDMFTILDSTFYNNESKN